jgi:hypothetical protein
MTGLLVRAQSSPDEPCRVDKRWKKVFMNVRCSEFHGEGIVRSSWAKIYGTVEPDVDALPIGTTGGFFT